MYKDVSAVLRAARVVKDTNAGIVSRATIFCCHIVMPVGDVQPAAQIALKLQIASPAGKGSMLMEMPPARHVPIPVSLALP